MNKQTSNSILPCVRDAVARGWVVFPLKHGSKEPACKWRDDDLPAIGDTDTGYGIDCCRSGLTVLDIDGETGCDSFDALLDKYGLEAWPDTYSVLTQGGGYHLYFQASGHHNSAKKIARGIDVRGDGGYVVGAGSVVNGRPYDLVNDAAVADWP